MEDVNKNDNVTNETKEQYSKWYNLLSLPIISSFYFFFFVFGFIRKFIYNVAKEDKREKTYVKDKRGNIDTSQSYKIANLIRVIILGAVVYLTYTAIIACLKVFNYSLETPIVFILPLCLAGTASLFLSNSFKNYISEDNNSSLVLGAQAVIGVIISLAATYYLYDTEFLSLGDKRDQKDGIFSVAFVPLFIFSGYIVPLLFSFTAITLTLKDKNKTSKALIGTGTAFVIGLALSYFQYSTVTNVVTSSENVAMSEQQRYEDREAAYKESREEYRKNLEKSGYTRFPDEIMSARYNFQMAKEVADRKLKGTGRARLLIIPRNFTKAKVKISGIDSFAYGMEVPAGEYKVTIESEGYKTYKKVHQFDEGGNLIEIKLER